MHFDSVENILDRLEQQPGWEKFRDYRQLLKCWNNTVNQNTARHTRPLYINRQVLWVATEGAARAQELSFQRYTLLKRLNKKLPFTLKDIRFSSSGWHVSTHEVNQSEIMFRAGEQKSESRFRSRSQKKEIDPEIESRSLDRDRFSANAKAKFAAQRWLDKVHQNSSSWLSCPKCNAPTSTKEIKRWNLCYLCVSRKWSQEYRPPSFPESK